jgi:magnesium-transporting ATPase (P-type)
MFSRFRIFKAIFSYSGMNKVRGGTEMTEFKRAADFHRAGLDAEQAKTSADQFGRNVLSKQRRKSFLKRFLGNLNDPVIRILLGALCVNLILAVRGTDWVETVGIAIAVFLAAFISTLSECSSERAFEELSRESE